MRRSASTLDVEGDGDIDVLLDKALWINTGAGFFTEPNRVGAFDGPIRSGSPSSLATGDLDGDGDTDALFGKGAFTDDRATSAQAYLNNATGPGLVELESDELFFVVDEGGEIVRDFAVDVRIRRIGGSEGPAAVSLVVRSDDIVLATSTREWASGEAGERRVSVLPSAFPDAYSDVERVRVELVRQSGVEGGFALGTPTTAVIKRDLRSASSESEGGETGAGGAVASELLLLALVGIAGYLRRHRVRSAV